MRTPSESCLMLERQVAWRALSRAWAKTGKRMAARMAMMAITTRSSISVKPDRERRARCMATSLELAREDLAALPVGLGQVRGQEFGQFGIQTRGSAKLGEADAGLLLPPDMTIAEEEVCALVVRQVVQFVVQPLVAVSARADPARTNLRGAPV